MPFAERTAQDYMRLYRYRDKTASLADLQEARRKIEEIETAEKQSEAKRQRERITNSGRRGKGRKNENMRK